LINYSCDGGRRGKDCLDTVGLKIAVIVLFCALSVRDVKIMRMVNVV
jgi:hypothetical protein